ncbi:MAG: hypothetical protein ACRC5A_13790 [Enterobacteriaceae bacterium]
MRIAFAAEIKINGGRNEKSDNQKSNYSGSATNTVVLGHPLKADDSSFRINIVGKKRVVPKEVSKTPQHLPNYLTGKSDNNSNTASNYPAYKSGNQ